MNTKIKMAILMNDPKFRDIEWNPETKESIINKIYAGQKKISRAKIVADSNNSLVESERLSVRTDIDFLQSKIRAYEHNVIIDIEQVLEQKDKIKDNYQEIGQFYDQRNQKFRKMQKIAKDKIRETSQLEKSFMQFKLEVDVINDIFQENQKLKAQIFQLKNRVNKKKKMLQSSL